MPQTVCGKDGKSKLLNYSYVQILRTTKHFSYHVVSIYLPFLKGKDGKDGQNGEIFNNFSVLFYREELFICFSGINKLQFVFRTGRDGRDGINGDVSILV